MKKFIYLVIDLSFLSTLAAADIHIKAKSHTDAFTLMGQPQPEKNVVTEQWIGDDRFASHDPEQSIIIDGKKNLLYFINHKEKTYLETPTTTGTSGDRARHRGNFRCLNRLT